MTTLQLLGEAKHCLFQAKEKTEFLHYPERVSKLLRTLVRATNEVERMVRLEQEKYETNEARENRIKEAS